jgi:hypothetical protein
MPMSSFRRSGSFAAFEPPALVTGFDDVAVVRQPVEQRQRGRCVVRLSRRQAEPEREALPVDDRMDLGREPAPGATEAMISTPLFAVAAC